MNITLPIECSDGHQYLLKLTDCKNLPIETTIEIVDIALISMSKIDIVNNAGNLNRIASILFNFLEENDVILYFYCSKDPIKKKMLEIKCLINIIVVLYLLPCLIGRIGILKEIL